MARVFIGDSSRIDAEVLSAVSLLPDDFWVFGEFNTVGRNVDWLVVREAPDGWPAAPSTLIVTELKRLPRAIRGRSTDEPWEIQGDDGAWQEYRPANDRDYNPYWQAVNTANALKNWLWNNQPLYSDSAVNEQEFAVWPDLLLLSPPGTVPSLPMRPASRFGAWWYNLDDWRGHLEAWRPKKGKPFRGDELGRLAEVLRLRPLTPLEPVSPQPEAPVSLDGLVGSIRALEARVKQLEDEVRLGRAATPAAAPRPIRPFTAEERDALVAAVNDTRMMGKSRATPTILGYLSTRLGYDLKATGYNGFGTAGRFFEQARDEGIVVFGPASGPNPTVFLPNELGAPVEGFPQFT
ncbi:MAG: hypothetical protein U0556_12940 [Dehalococcoidia bacterium]